MQNKAELIGKSDKLRLFWQTKRILIAESTNCQKTLDNYEKF